MTIKLIYQDDIVYVQSSVATYEGGKASVSKKAENKNYAVTLAVNEYDKLISKIKEAKKELLEL